MKGFTLIEVLAVIVILAIIVIISVPLVGSTIDAVKENSFKIAVKHLEKAAEITYYSDKSNRGREIIFEFNNYEVTSNYPDAKLEFNGQGPKNGNLIIRKDGKISYSFYNGDKCAQKSYDDVDPTISSKVSGECISEITLPSVVLLGENPQYIEINDTYTDLGVVAKTIAGEDITNILIKYMNGTTEIPSLPLNTLGSYRVIYTVKEDEKVNYTERSVIVRDTIAPVINVPLSTSIVISDVNGFNASSGATVTDNSGEVITPSISGGIARIAGSYELTYSATDSSGNTTSVVRIINVNDIDAPVITLNGASVININVGDTYTELNATSLDDADGDLTSSIIKTGTVNTNTPGTYLITYTSKDSSNNESSITRTVNVIDNIAPTVEFVTNGNVTYATTRSTVVNVSDNVLVVSRQYQWTTSTTAPTSASFTQTFTNGATITSPAGVSGTYYLWIKAVDNSGNETIIRSNAFNLDNQNPVIVLNGASSINVNVGGPYTELGATATDNINGNITGDIEIYSPVNVNAVGSYTVTYDVSDSSGNSATQLTRTVNVIDNVEPTIVFGTNGNATYAKTRSTSVTVDDVHGLVVSRQYQWTTSTTAPTSASFTQTFTNGATITTPAGVSGTYYLWIKAVDNSSNEIITRSNVFNIDNTIPTVAFGTAGTTTAVKSITSTVTVTDNSTITGLYYQVTVSPTAPSSASFATTFTNGQAITVTSPAGAANSYYLWIKAVDVAGNERIITTNYFNIDNMAPTLFVSPNGNATYAKTNTVTISLDDLQGGSGNATSYYQWTTSATAPTSASFSLTFNDDAAIATPAGVTGSYYIWVKAIDLLGNTSIQGGQMFNLDNSGPVVSSITTGTTSLATTSFTITRSGNATDAHSGLAASPYVYQTSPNGSTWTTRCTNNTTSCAVSGLTSSTTYYYRICANDTLSNQSCTASKTVTTNSAVVDTTNPVVTFSPTGNSTAAPEQYVTVTVTDNIAVASRYYQWTTSTTAPSAASFTTTFTSGQQIMSPYVYLPSANTNYYLWVKATDTSGNTVTVRSNAFLVKAITMGEM